MPSHTVEIQVHEGSSNFNSSMDVSYDGKIPKQLASLQKIHKHPTYFVLFLLATGQFVATYCNLLAHMMGGGELVGGIRLTALTPQSTGALGFRHIEQCTSYEKGMCQF